MSETWKGHAAQLSMTRRELAALIDPNRNAISSLAAGVIVDRAIRALTQLEWDIEREHTPTTGFLKETTKGAT